MKYFFYIFFLLFTTHYCRAQIAYRLVATSAYTYNGAWQPGDSTQYIYYNTSRGQNTAGNWLYDKAMLYKNNGQWDSVQRFTQTFDAHNNVVIRKDEKPIYGWAGGDYRDSFGYYHSATGKYVVCAQLRKKWNTIFNNWEPYELYTCYVDTSLMPQNMLKQTWNHATLLWDNTELETYTYDAHRNLVAKVLYTFNTSTQLWDPIERTGISYFSPTLYSRTVISKHKGNVWVDSISTNYNYNSKNEPITETHTISNVTSSTSATVWTNNKKYTRTFDANHNVLTEITQQWKSTTSSWDNTQRLSKTYNTGNNVTTATTETWDASTNSWVYDASSVYKRYYYGIYFPTGVQVVNELQPSFVVYPNPSAGVFTIDMVSQHFKAGTVRIYDAIGREVYSESPIPNSKFPINLNVPKGVYFVKLQLDDTVSIKQLVIE